MKRNNGITLVTLVITIIILLIIAGVTISVGSVSINLHKDKILSSELKEIQIVVMQQYQKHLTVKDESLLIGTKCAISGDINATDKEYYLLNVEDLEKLGMENAKDTYIVNYKTGEVINKTSKNSKGEELHLQGVKEEE